MERIEALSGHGLHDGCQGDHRAAATLQGHGQGLATLQSDVARVKRTRAGTAWSQEEIGHRPAVTLGGA
jgi:hypothetical protein